VQPRTENTAVIYYTHMFILHALVSFCLYWLYCFSTRR